MRAEQKLRWTMNNEGLYIHNNARMGVPKVCYKHNRVKCLAVITQPGKLPRVSAHSTSGSTPETAVNRAAEQDTV